MNKTAVDRIIKNVLYPGLDKTLGALDVIKEVSVRDNSARIVLTMQNEKVFDQVQKRIQKALGDMEADVVFDAGQKKRTDFGTTRNPNNKAAYADKVIAISSGKGGVGKSSVAVNIAVGLAQQGNKVGLLDADVYGPSIPRMMQIEQEKLQWNENNKIVPSENFGIKIMSVGLTTPKSDTPLVWRSSVAISALMQFLEDVEWGSLDYLIIDMPPGTGDVQLSMAQELHLDGAVLVTTPQTVSLDDVSRSIMMFKDIGIHVAGVVENMSYFIAPDTGKSYEIFGSGGGAALQERYGVPLLGKIPLTMENRQLADEGKVAVAFGDDESKRIYKEIIAKLP